MTRVAYRSVADKKRVTHSVVFDTFSAVLISERTFYNSLVVDQVHNITQTKKSDESKGCEDLCSSQYHE